MFGCLIDVDPRSLRCCVRTMEVPFSDTRQTCCRATSWCAESKALALRVTVAEGKAARTDAIRVAGTVAVVRQLYIAGHCCTTGGSRAVSRSDALDLSGAPRTALRWTKATTAATSIVRSHPNFAGARRWLTRIARPSTEPDARSAVRLIQSK
jgi:hypothetical protein